MNGKELLIGLSYIDRKFIEESEMEFPVSQPAAAEKKTRRRPLSRRIWLIAAAVALTLLLVGCAVVVYTRIQMKLVQHSVPAATAAASAAQEMNPVRNPLTSCYPQSLPAGYQLWEGAQRGHHTRAIDYRNADGKLIIFCISTYEPIDITLAPPMEKITMTVSGWDALMQVKENGAQAFSWYNEDEGYYVSVYTEDMAVDLQALAESVEYGPALPLSFLCREGEIWDVWYPQQLPQGYTCEGVSPFSGGMQFVDYTLGDARIVYGVSLTTNFKDDATPPPNDPYTWEDLTVAGQPATMLTTPGQRVLYWKNEQEGFYAMLNVSDPAVDILALAESVAPGEPLAVSAHHLGPDYTIELEQDESAYVGWEPVYPQWIPEGYGITFVSDPAYGDQIIRYENAEGKRITYEFYFRLGQWGREFEGVGQPEEITISGNPGYRLGNKLIWTDEAKGFGFMLDCEDGADLIAIAESVGIGPELKPTYADNTAKALEELGDYRITQLPEGMKEDAVTGCPLEDGGGWYSYIRRWYVDPNTNAQIYLEYETYEAGADQQDITLEEIAKMYIPESSPLELCTIQGCTGAVSQDGEYARAVWLMGDEAKGVCFCLISRNYTAQELLTMAQSVQKQ